MQINKIGIIGNGFVGNAIYENLKLYFKTLVYDKIPARCRDNFEDTIYSDLVFVCLPTPMKTAEGGECNVSFIENFFYSLPTDIKSIFVIKSTVPIGTTKKIQNTRKDLKIIHNPEFLTAANAINDFKNSERHVIGGDIEYCKILEKVLKTVTPESKVIFVSAEESESIKYFANTFLAIKVSYFNMIYDLSLKLNINYDNIVSGVCSDSRIGYSHTKVPGIDNERGFGGTCFPKDINSLIDTFDKNNLNVNILKQVWEYNKNIRKRWDWAESESAVFNGENK